MATHGTHSGHPAPRRRILRIGVLLGGKIIEERLIRDRSPVSIGQSSRNTFSVPLEHLPREWTLFAVAEGQYQLQFAPRMDGRISDGAQVYTFEQVKGTRAIQRADHWLMPLSDQARGKVTIGDLTILFQFVTEPPAQPKPMLPASVRGTLADRIEPRLAVVTAISIVIHFAIAVAAWVHDPPAPRNTLGARAAAVTVDTVEPLVLEPQMPLPAEDTPDEADEADQGAEQPAEKKPAATTPRQPAGGGGGRKETDAAALQEEAARYAAALAGSTVGDKGLGPLGRVSPGGELDEQLKEVREGGGKVEVGGGGDRGTRGDGDPRTGTGKGPRVEGPGGTTSASGPGGKAEKEPTGRIQVASRKTFDDTSLSPEAVLGRIQSVYMAGLKRCYKDLLKSDPTARGRVELSFTVNESGRTTSPRAKSDYPSLSSCVQGLMAGWTFPAPKDRDGDRAEASFQITLALQPD
jgi:outer membrane biosynthesis protein TonB